LTLAACDSTTGKGAEELLEGIANIDSGYFFKALLRDRVRYHIYQMLAIVFCPFEVCACFGEPCFYCLCVDFNRAVAEVYVYHDCAVGSVTLAGEVEKLLVLQSTRYKRRSAKIQDEKAIFEYETTSVEITHIYSHQCSQP
jgi:hypothetical protein